MLRLVPRISPWNSPNCERDPIPNDITNRDTHTHEKGNIRTYAYVLLLVCLSNLENLNALFIKERTQL
jgi:hypothetical protein